MRNPLTLTEFTVESAQQYVENFSKLKDNWNLYKACAITPKAIAAAKDLLSLVKEVPQPIPLSNGGIMLTWLWNGKEVNIQLDRDGKLDFDE